MLNGGFGEFVGALGGCSAISAIMSTADSAVIGVGSLVTRDIVQGFIAPNMKTSQLMSISKIISFVVIFIGCLVPLADETVRTDGVIYGFLIGLQCTFLWHALPAYSLSIFGDSTKATPVFLGQIVGIITMIGLIAGAGVLTKDCGRMKNCYGTGFKNAHDMDAQGEGASSGVGGLWLDFGIWSGFVNCAVVALMYLINVPDFLGGGKMNYPEKKMKLFGNNKLDGAEIRKIMSGTVEPCSFKNPVGCGFTFVGVIAMVLALPWYGEPNDGCNLQSYEAWKNCKMGKSLAEGETKYTGKCDATFPGIKWTDHQGDGSTHTCKPSAFIGGIPNWAFGIHFGWAIGIICLLIANSTWVVHDDQTMEEIDAAKYENGKNKPTGYDKTEQALEQSY